MTLYEMTKLIYFRPQLLGILIIFNFLWGFCKMVIYNKLGIKNSWIAFIPILSYKPMFEIAGLNPLLLLVGFIPYVGSFLYSMALVAGFYYFFINVGYNINQALLYSVFVLFAFVYIAFFNDRVLYCYRRNVIKSGRLFLK